MSTFYKKTPDSVEDLTPKERAFYDSMISTIPEGELLAKIGKNVALRFVVPFDFTKNEFDRVGHRLTCLMWNWQEIGNRKDRDNWAYLLLPLG